MVAVLGQVGITICRYLDLVGINGFYLSLILLHKHSIACFQNGSSHLLEMLSLKLSDQSQDVLESDTYPILATIVSRWLAVS